MHPLNRDSMTACERTVPQMVSRPRPEGKDRNQTGRRSWRFSMKPAHPVYKLTPKCGDSRQRGLADLSGRCRKMTRPCAGNG